MESCWSVISDFWLIHQEMLENFLKMLKNNWVHTRKLFWNCRNLKFSGNNWKMLGNSRVFGKLFWDCLGVSVFVECRGLSDGFGLS